MVQILILLLLLAASAIGQVLQPGNGGTGTSTPPTSAQILVGNGTGGYAPKTVSGSCTLSTAGVLTCSGSGTPGGSDTQVQFNDGGAFGGNSEFIYNKSTHVLTVGTGSSQGTIDYLGGAGSPSNPASGNCREYFNTTSGKMEYINSSGSSCAPGTASPLTTKGDIYIYGSSDTRLAVGADGSFLTADSTQTTGLKWVSRPTIIGQAVFSAAGGTIGSATYSGVVTSVTRTGTGAFTVNISPAQSNFAISVVCNTDHTSARFAQVDTANFAGTATSVTSFAVSCFQFSTSANADPGYMSVILTK